MGEKSSSGIGLGTIGAVVVSWLINHSIGWALVHGLFGWFYIIYWGLGYAGQIPAEALPK